MTTKKLVIIVGSIVAGVVVAGALLIGGIVGVAFYSIGKSEAAATAKNFLRSNEKLIEDIGEVRDFGFFITGNVKVDGSDGVATLNLKVIGARRTVNATVDLAYTGGRDWRVIDASYETETGQTVNLMRPGEPGGETDGDRE
jgi:hypothetical protein